MMPKRADPESALVVGDITQLGCQHVGRTPSRGCGVPTKQLATQFFGGHVEVEQREPGLIGQVFGKDDCRRPAALQADVNLVGRTFLRT